MNDKNPYVVIVEDYQLLREQLEDFLVGHGFTVSTTDSGDRLDEVLRLRLPDILILDLNLPGEDGLSIARRVKAIQPGIGVIMMTARITGADKVAGYQSGADVYITKPAKSEELLAAMNNLLQRLKPISESSRAWTLRFRESKVETPEGHVIPLTANELIIFESLVMSPDRKVETDVLVSKLKKSEDEFSKNQLEAMISRLRKKITNISGSSDVIRSVWGYGYQLCINCIAA